MYQGIQRYLKQSDLGSDYSHVSQQNNPIDSLLQPLELQQDPIEEVAVLVEDNLAQTTLEQLTSQTQSCNINQFSFTLAISDTTLKKNHAVQICYDNNNADKPWLFMDINRMPIKHCNTSELKDEINDTLSELNLQPEQSILLYNIETLSSQKQKAQPLQHWVEQHNEATMSHKLSKDKKVAFLSMISQKRFAHLETLQPTLKGLDDATFESFYDQYGQSAFSKARYCNLLPHILDKLLERQVTLAEKYAIDRLPPHLTFDTNDISFLFYKDPSLAQQPIQKALSIHNDDLFINDLIRELKNNLQSEEQVCQNLQFVLFSQGLRSPLKKPRVRNHLHQSNCTQLHGILAQYDIFQNMRYNRSQDLTHLFEQHPKISNDILARSTNPVNGQTLLHLAAWKGQYDNVTQLVDHYDIDVNLSESLTGLTPLHLAAQQGHTDVINQLIRSGANLEQTSLSGITPLHLAAENGHLDTIQTLVNNTKDTSNAVFVTDCMGKTALDYAYNNLDNHHGVIDYLQSLAKKSFENSANHSERNINNLPDINTAAYYGLKETTSSLIAQMAPNRQMLNTQDKQGNTPLHNAISQGHKTIVKQLIDIPNVDINQPNHAGTTTAFLALQYGYIDYALHICNHNDFDSNTRNASGYNLLHLAISKGQMAFALELIESLNFDKEATTSYQQKPLHLLVESEHSSPELLEHLSTPQSINYQDKLGDTPLMQAVLNDDLATVKQLIDYGADPSIKNNRGYTPLGMADNDAIYESLTNKLCSQEQPDQEEAEQRSFRFN